MKAIVFMGLALILPLLSAKAPLIAPTPAQSPWEQQKMFHLPEGFDIQLVASEPAIGQPMNLNFDARGRLWVTHSIEYPYPAKSTEVARDKLTVLEDLTPDGRPQHISHFANGLSIPIGQTPLGEGDSAIIFSVPNIYRTSNGTIEKLYGTIGRQDTHGLVNSFTPWIDGWIYGCHGFRNRSDITDGAGNITSLQSGNTYRFKADGSHFEQYTWGQVNPFGLTFDAWGNIFTADCHSKPLTMLLRGGYYPSFGKAHDGLGFAPDIIHHDHGSTGICGPAFYEATAFPEEYHHTIFLCNPVNGIVHWDKFIQHGSTLMVDSQPDFITCDDPWFRPVDAQMGPDGALYIADFYNAIIGHYEVPLAHPKRDRTHGRIWRVIHKDATHKLPDLTQDPAAFLNHPNLLVRTLATNLLVDRKTSVGAAGTSQQRVHTMWIEERLHTLSDESLIAYANDSDPLVRTHFFRVLENRSALPQNAGKLLRAGLQDGNPFVQRAAAQATGQHPAEEYIPSLLALLETTIKEDVQLIHTVRIALRNHLRDLPDLTDLKPTQQMADIAIAVKKPAAAKFLSQTLPTLRLSAKYFTHIAQVGSDSAISSALTYNHTLDFATQVLNFKAMNLGLKKGGRSKNTLVRTSAEQRLESAIKNKPRNYALLCSLIEEFQLTKHTPQLAEWAADDALPAPGRERCCQALLTLDPHAGLHALLKTEPGHTVFMAIAHRDEQHTSTLLTEFMTNADQSKQTIIAQRLVADKQGAKTLLQLVEAGKASPHLLNQPSTKNRLINYQLQTEAALLTKELPPQSATIDALIRSHSNAYPKAARKPEQGAETFSKYCSLCHQIGEIGKPIGPHLAGIGSRGMNRLLEDVLDPNRNVDAHFRTSFIKTEEANYVGLILRTDGALTILVDSAGNEIQIETSKITKHDQSPVSLMPASFGETIPESAFLDLMAYLLSLK